MTRIKTLATKRLIQEQSEGLLKVLLPPSNGIFKKIILQTGDVILNVNGKPSLSADYFIKRKDLFTEKGDINTISVWRNQTNVSITKNK